jgi:hypothetical protein
MGNKEEIQTHVIRLFLYMCEWNVSETSEYLQSEISQMNQLKLY